MRRRRWRDVQTDPVFTDRGNSFEGSELNRKAAAPFERRPELWITITFEGLTREKKVSRNLFLLLLLLLLLSSSHDVTTRQKSLGICGFAVEKFTVETM